MRFRVRTVQMYDVVDTESGDLIVFNTRDEDDADRVAMEHEALYETEEQK